VIQRPPNTEPPTWTQAPSDTHWRETDGSRLRRFIGGPPLGVAIKLVLVSLIVGAVLMWLHISPAELFQELADLAHRLALLGFQSLHDFGAYITAGAMIVVPVWLILRLLSYRGR